MGAVVCRVCWHQLLFTLRGVEGRGIFLGIFMGGCEKGGIEGAGTRREEEKYIIYTFVRAGRYFTEVFESKIAKTNSFQYLSSLFCRVKPKSSIFVEH